MAAVLDFPVCVGPFTMSPARLAGAFNAFYRQHQFPKPDPTSDENSMAGLDPSAAGQGMRDIVFGQISPLHEITLDEETKAAELKYKCSSEITKLFSRLLNLRCPPLREL